MDIINPFAKILMNALLASGYESYLVGGCVRDYLLGNTPHDWDITTSATPKEMLIVFKDYKILDVGIIHGTLIIISAENQKVEITTFRKESGYSDGRRPDKVLFSKNLIDDVSRRDFTINAICMDINGDIIDLLNGIEDLKTKTIKAVGEPVVRFEEDALRILRAVRFSAQLGFEIEGNTLKAMQNISHRIKVLSPERIFTEIDKLILAPNACDVMLSYSDIIFSVFPALRAQNGVYQRSDYHCYDVYTHTIKAMCNIKPISHLRWTMLLHDIGKPSCSDGKGSFKGHAKKGAVIADEILTNLNCSNAFKKKVTLLVRLHSITLREDERELQSMIKKFGADAVLDLISVCVADNGAKNIAVAQAKKNYYKQVKRKLVKVLLVKPPVTVKNLSVNGDDLVLAGFSKGVNIGKLLRRAVFLVRISKVSNNKEEILACLKAETISD